MFQPHIAIIMQQF
uniref:Uncharacterized protein n=1 Tax=Arundo donax TaxID=35708 RepID=A0A0A9ASU7_ARUDO